MSCVRSGVILDDVKCGSNYEIKYSLAKETV